MARHYVQLLGEAVSAPESRLSELSMVDAEEREQLLRWGRAEAVPEVPEVAGGTLAELFEAQVRRSPEAEAVSLGEEGLSYGELNRRANRLAHRLRELGVGPESRVGLCAERSLELVVGVLGILKAGGAYVPLDPEYPAERLAYMVEDSGVRVAVTSEQGGDRLPGGLEVVGLEGHEGQPEADPAPLAGPQNLAYVIYTSGSTGRPKGVMVEHRNLLHLVSWNNSAYLHGTGVTSTAVASPSFDASVWEVFPPLLCGGTVALAPAKLLADVDAIGEWLQAVRPDVVFMPTPVLEALLDGKPRWLFEVRALLTGGDVLHRRPPGGVRAESPPALTGAGTAPALAGRWRPRGRLPPPPADSAPSSRHRDGSDSPTNPPIPFDRKRIPLASRALCSVCR